MKIRVRSKFFYSWKIYREIPSPILNFFNFIFLDIGRYACFTRWMSVFAIFIWYVYSAFLFNCGLVFFFFLILRIVVLYPQEVRVASLILKIKIILEKILSFYCEKKYSFLQIFRLACVNTTRLVWFRSFTWSRILRIKPVARHNKLFQYRTVDFLFFISVILEYNPIHCGYGHHHHYETGEKVKRFAICNLSTLS